LLFRTVLYCGFRHYNGSVPLAGKGISIWDTFCHGGGIVRGNVTGDVACDSYHRYPEDIAILKNLGASDIRPILVMFSIWNGNYIAFFASAPVFL